MVITSVLIALSVFAVVLFRNEIVDLLVNIGVIGNSKPKRNKKVSGKARKKPVVIDYFNYQNDNPFGVNGLYELILWVDSFGDVFQQNFTIPSNKSGLIVKTLEGTSYNITTDDVIIRGIKGEYYPCKRNIFFETYEIV